VPKELPDTSHVTAVEAVCWLGSGNALTTQDIAEITAEKFEEMQEEAKQWQRVLFDAHMRHKVRLTGRRRNAARPYILDSREPIPLDYFADKVTLNLRTNSIEADASVEEFAVFERNQDLYWEEVMVPVREVRILGTPKSGGSTIVAETRCKHWLVEQMRASQSAPEPKSYYKSEAKKLFDVSGHAFDRAWRGSIRDTGHFDWSKAGRKSKK
jgi:hypothetical protein